MVRIIAGTLAEVGTGLRPVSSMHDVLEARDRRVAGATAPAQGLTLMAVRYSL
jgi:tRNA pseudouridine38-40 synthase